MKTVTILGSTGSIGRNTIKVLELYRDKFRVKALTAHANVELLAEQAVELKPELVVIADKNLYSVLAARLSGTGINIEAGDDALVAAAAMSSDIVVSAIVGSAGLKPTLAALERGALVALANKECLVCAGEIMVATAKKYGATIIPVDSEHSAIFQVFDCKNPQNIAKIILTASGGPFRERTLDQMRLVTAKEAIMHPNWQMGAKISVDSATMMNKGLEVIEAAHLFPVTLQQIEVILHPESVVHSLVEYIDGSILAQLGTPDMRTPIAFALAWPERIALSHPKLNLTSIARLNFQEIAHDKFPAINLCYAALKQGGNIPTILNIANEVAVTSFLAGKIGFLDIVEVVSSTIARSQFKQLYHIGDVFNSMAEAEDIARELTSGYQ